MEGKNGGGLGTRLMKIMTCQTLLLQNFSAHARKHNLTLLENPIKVIPPVNPLQLQELRTKKHFSKETTVKSGAWYIQSQVLQRREEEGGGGRGERGSPCGVARTDRKGTVKSGAWYIHCTVKCFRSLENNPSHNIQFAWEEFRPM